MFSRPAGTWKQVREWPQAARVRPAVAAPAPYLCHLAYQEYVSYTRKIQCIGNRIVQWYIDSFYRYMYDSRLDTHSEDITSRSVVASVSRI